MIGIFGFTCRIDLNGFPSPDDPALYRAGRFPMPFGAIALASPGFQLQVVSSEAQPGRWMKQRRYCAANEDRRLVLWWL